MPTIQTSGPRLLNLPKAAVPNPPPTSVDTFVSSKHSPDLQLPPKQPPNRDADAVKETLLGVGAVAAAGVAVYGAVKFAGPAVVSAVSAALAVSPWISIPAAGMAYVMGGMGVMAADGARTDAQALCMGLVGSGVGAALGAVVGCGAGMLLHTAVQLLL